LCVMMTMACKKYKNKNKRENSFINEPIIVCPAITGQMKTLFFLSFIYLMRTSNNNNNEIV
jgi:hypothetical protein